ncbi:hypothetical protein ACIB24_20880 [Spongisporangium articulatum]|uniref:Uncharacterized protein n=1 Tax=Spongisporangium articulatum TaxID=3362603 RepID=A0ABW8AT05_9ACTN
MKIVSSLARRADELLAESAARNAAHSVEVRKVRQLDDIRTLRDLERIPAARRGGIQAEQG